MQSIQLGRHFARNESSVRADEVIAKSVGEGGQSLAGEVVEKQLKSVRTPVALGLGIVFQIVWGQYPV